MVEETVALQEDGVETETIPFMTKDEFSQFVTDTLMTNRAYFSKRDWLIHFGKKTKEAKREELDMFKEELFAKSNFVMIAGKTAKDGLFTTQAMLDMENEMLTLAAETTNAHVIPENLVSQTFLKYPTMADEQKEVVKASCTGNRRVVVTEGTAGAGKSFSLNAIREIYEKVPASGADSQGYHIIGTALSWTATKVLEASAGLRGGRAIEGLLREMEKASVEKRSYFPKRTLLIVDEAGLVGTDHMHKLLKLTSESKVPVRVILTGDSLQLNPVMRGNSLELIVAKNGSARLDTIRRQKQASHRAAVKHFCYGRAENGLWIFEHQEAIHVLEDKNAVFRRIIDDYISYRVSFPEKKALVLALKNDEVDWLNREIRKEWLELGFLGEKAVTLNTTDMKSVKEMEFRVGDRIVFRKNAPKHPIFKTGEAYILPPKDDSKDAKKDIKENKKQPPVVKPTETKAETAPQKKGLFARLFSKKEEPIQPSISQQTSTHSEVVEQLPEPEIKLPEPERAGVFNRSGGTITEIMENSQGFPAFRIVLDEGGECIINTNEYLDDKTGAVPLVHNFATTIYASQGQTVERVFMADSPLMNRRLAYVGMSRHTELCDLYVNRSELISRKGPGMEPAANNISREELLARMAFSWNAPSDNRTATMVMEESKGDGMQITLRRLHPADGDKADDHHIFYPRVAMKHKGEDDHPHPDVPVPGRVHDGKAILLDMEGVNEDAIVETKGIIWTSGRHGDIRIVALGHDGHPSSRYTPDGRCVVGGGDIPLWKNDAGNEKTPVLVVQSPREAVIAWHHYRKTRAEKPETIPHIALHFGDTRLETLFDHLTADTPIYVGHSKSRPETLIIAEKIADDIRKNGRDVDILPRKQPEKKPHP